MDYDTAELNRLTGRGLDPRTAFAVYRGELDESAAVAVAEERRAVEQWLADLETPPLSLTPLWDLASNNFYQVFDGASPGDSRVTNLLVVDANVDEVLRKLSYASGRAHGPWHEEFRRKTGKTAYRWQNGLPVTPPLIADYDGSVHIKGGMHRFHLAATYNVVRMPFLVEQASVESVLNILSTAQKRESVD